ncbi:hypothetical protein UlMin_025666 [Ulmus minor]
MLSTIVIGIAYSCLQVPFSIYKVEIGMASTEGNTLFEFYADKIMSYLLISGGPGGAAGFAISKEMNNFFGRLEVYYMKFFEKAYVSASLLLLAFVCTAISSVISSHALPKRQNSTT